MAVHDLKMSESYREILIYVRINVLARAPQIEMPLL